MVSRRWETAIEHGKKEVAHSCSLAEIDASWRCRRLMTLTCVGVLSFMVYQLHVRNWKNTK